MKKLTDNFMKQVGLKPEKFERNYGSICRQNNEQKITCAVCLKGVPRWKFLPSEGMCGDCFIVYSADMEKLADERDEARSEHEEYIMAH